jgi:hypothetical protein
VRYLFVVLAQLSVAAAGGMSAFAAGSTPAGSPVEVVPTAGGPGTVFLVRFRAPDRTGVEGTLQRFDVVRVSAAATGTRPGCLSGINLQLPVASKGSLVRVQLPSRAHRAGGWCPAVYQGAISEQERPVCRRGQTCPTYIRLLRSIGRFTFTVQARPSPAPTITSTTTTPTATTQTTTASNTTPPTFGGLQSAFACTPGPQRPGETTPFRLSWQPANDNITPSSEIVYEVYLATTPGGENFSIPTWTTAAGATSFETPGLASHGSFYFVVRARDSAGNEDHNTTEVHGSDPCV